MMNIKMRVLWKLIKFFTAEKSIITFCAWGLRVIFTGCLWKCGSSTDILACNIIKHLNSSVFFLVKSSGKKNLFDQKSQEGNLLFTFLKSHPKSFIDLNPRNNLNVINHGNTSENQWIVKENYEAAIHCQPRAWFLEVVYITDCQG